MAAVSTSLIELSRFKKSGEFDRLRRELLTQFQNSVCMSDQYLISRLNQWSQDGMDAFMARVEDIALKRLDSDSKLYYISQEIVHRELMQELDRYTISQLRYKLLIVTYRYPIVERALAEVQTLSDPAFVGGIRKHAHK